MPPPSRTLLAAIAALAARYAFRDESLLVALRMFKAWDGTLPFAALTPRELRRALVVAADQGLVREVEIRPGLFLMVRTGLTASPPFEVSSQIAEALAKWVPGIEQPEPEQLGRALDSPVEVVALRRAILDSRQFVWPWEDRAALLKAAGGEARPEQ